MYVLEVLLERTACSPHFRWETTTITVSYTTPIELIEKLKANIGEYISSNSREWSDFALNINKVEFQNALHLSIAIERELPFSTGIISR